ncbi:ABC transporter ATP-binding protein [uncultured Tessaracoccus sp.]|uniref:ABC transporter ATP-binding protein n=1 Tax=uncultured Tessaracoccus sp. TaxID=905023 RepID=UPI0026306255|nr:ABC transporter ATP-binding protein [uncultured Tessaracoccus sp.]
MIEAKGLTKRFGEQTVLREVDVRIDDGEFVAIMGPSGSGKSTLLYLLSGIDTPDEGTVELLGHELGTMSQRALANLRLQQLGFVFQQPRLLSTLSLLDNVMFPGMVAGKRNRDEVLARARTLLAGADVAQLEDRDVTQASGGQLQRVAICRALIGEPDVLFCDEPTGALNSANAMRVMQLIAREAKAGTTVVMVTHDAAVAAFADRVLMLADGAIVGDRRLTGNTDSRHTELLQWLQEAHI